MRVRILKFADGDRENSKFLWSTSSQDFLSELFHCAAKLLDFDTAKICYRKKATRINWLRHSFHTEQCWMNWTWRWYNYDETKKPPALPSLQHLRCALFVLLSCPVCPDQPCRSFCPVCSVCPVRLCPVEECELRRTQLTKFAANLLKNEFRLTNFKLWVPRNYCRWSFRHVQSHLSLVEWSHFGVIWHVQSHHLVAFFLTDGICIWSFVDRVLAAPIALDWEEYNVTDNRGEISSAYLKSQLWPFFFYFVSLSVLWICVVYHLICWCNCNFICV